MLCAGIIARNGITTSEVPFTRQQRISQLQYVVTIYITFRMSNTEGPKDRRSSSPLAEPINNTPPSSEDDLTPQLFSPCLSPVCDRDTGRSPECKLNICVSIQHDDKLHICVSTQPDHKLSISIHTQPDHRLSISIHTQPNEDPAIHIEEEELTDIEDEAATDADD